MSIKVVCLSLGGEKMRYGDIELSENDSKAILFELKQNYTSQENIAVMIRAIETRKRILAKKKR